MKAIDEFIEGLCRIPEPDFGLEQVDAYLRSSPVDPLSIEPYLSYTPTHYTRNLIYKCDLFELLAICWDVGQVSQIHNHAGQNCWMSVPIGRLVVQNYDVIERDEARSHCKLRSGSHVLMDPSHPSHVDPGTPVHAILNPPEHAERATSLHIYSRPYDRCLVYSLEDDSFREVPLFYDSEGRRPQAPQAKSSGMSENSSLQDHYAPDNRCFGCGPANDKGLRIKSRVEGEELVADFTPEPHHQAFAGVLNGGIIGALLDCHSNWTAAWHLMRRAASDTLPSTVTAEFHVKLHRPTPLECPLRLRASVVESREDRATVKATLESGGTITATCRGVFVAVKEGHPAHFRW